MNAKKTLTASSILLATAAAAPAQSYLTETPPPPSPGFLNEWLRQKDANYNAWDVGVQVRLRYEVKDNFGVSQAGGGTAGANDFKANTGALTDDNLIFLQRVKPHIGYTSEWFSAFLEGRGSYTTGDQRNPNPEADGPMDIHQGYITVGNHKEFPLSLKVGRQELSYGDERLIGAFDWNNNMRTFDAAKLRWQNEYFWADFFSGRVVIPDDNNFNMPNDYDWFSGVYASTKLIPKQTTDLFFLSRNANTSSPTVNTASGVPAFLNGPPPRDIYTVGTRMKSLPGAYGPWDYTVELMAQFGHFNDPATLNPGGKSLEHEAYAACLNAGYTWTDAAWKPRLGVEYNFASGDSNPNDGKHGTFENLFPTNHKFYGIMDTISLQNMHNVRVGVSAKPLPRLMLALDYRAFWLADTHDNFYTVAGFRRGGIATTPGTGYGINPSYGGYVGSEMDLVATWTVNRFATAQVGYGHYFVGDYIRESLSSSAVGSTDANFCYVQMNLVF